jgi:hypothetical protein
VPGVVDELLEDAESSADGSADAIPWPVATPSQMATAETDDRNTMLGKYIAKRPRYVAKAGSASTLIHSAFPLAESAFSARCVNSATRSHPNWQKPIPTLHRAERGLAVETTPVQQRRYRSFPARATAQQSRNPMIGNIIGGG